MSNRTRWSWPIDFQWPSCETGVNNDEQYAKKQNRCKQMGKKLEDVNRWQRHQATRGGADGVLNRNDGGFCWNIKKKRGRVHWENGWAFLVSVTSGSMATPPTSFIRPLDGAGSFFRASVCVQIIQSACLSLLCWKSRLGLGPKSQRFLIYWMDAYLSTAARLSPPVIRPLQQMGYFNRLIHSIGQF